MKLDIGERFRAIRRSRSLSQSEFAELIGISMRYYQTIESGKGDPTFDTIYTALSALNISFSEFIGEKTQVLSKDEVELVTAFKKAGPLGKKTILGAAKGIVAIEYESQTVTLTKKAT